MDKQKAERWSGLPEAGEPPMLDVLASEARTALDDPAALGLPYRDGVNDYDPQVAINYAIGKLDETIGLLNPETETTETFRTTLTVLGRHLADRVDTMESLMLDDGEAVWSEAIERATVALDAIDEAINALTKDGAICTIYGQKEYMEVTPAEGRLLAEAGLVQPHHEYEGDYTPTPYGENEPWDDIYGVLGRRNA